MISVVCDECHSAGWRYGECHYVECRGAALMFVELLVYVQIFIYQSWNTDPRPLQTPGPNVIKLFTAVIYKLS
jgi:hypothetical protein